MRWFNKHTKELQGSPTTLSLRSTHRLKNTLQASPLKRYIYAMAQKHTFQRISGLSYDTFEEIFFLSFIYLKAARYATAKKHAPKNQKRNH
jgi:hypothetical protein